MPLQDMLILAAVLATFGTFAGTMLWATTR
ncbi:hypothetical protein HNR47_000618 [Methylopila jiangsuensis]|nr:hypothetical protein [Methylopila jiangsuensis]